MSDKLTKAKKILKKYHQEHLLYFYDEISENEKEVLLNQIIKIDFDEILNLYENSKQNTKLDLSKVSPLPHLEKNKLTREELDTYI